MNTEKLLELLSVQRHDFLNHLQVISGLIQMKKEDRAREYITDVGRDLKRMSKVAHLKVPEAAAAFLIGYNLAAGYQIDLKFEIQADLAGCTVPGEKLGAALEELIGALVNYLAPPEITDRTISVEIKQVDGGYSCRLQYRHILDEFENFPAGISGPAAREILQSGCSIDSNNTGGNCEITLFLPA